VPRLCKNNSDECAGFHGRQFISALYCVSFYCGNNYSARNFGLLIVDF